MVDQLNPLFKKLNLGANTNILVLNTPDSFEPVLASLHGVSVERKAEKSVSFALAFVITAAQLDAASRQLCNAAQGDAVLWMVYPKASSKKYQCEFNRDGGWVVLGAAGYEPVRQVAVDEDWSALRFRKAEFIKTVSRNPGGTISTLGREKALKQKESKRT
jgi:hypothetical protein